MSGMTGRKEAALVARGRQRGTGSDSEIRIPRSHLGAPSGTPDESGGRRVRWREHPAVPSDTRLSTETYLSWRHRRCPYQRALHPHLQLEASNAWGTRPPARRAAAVWHVVIALPAATVDHARMLAPLAAYRGRKADAVTRRAGSGEAWQWWLSGGQWEAA